MLLLLSNNAQSSTQAQMLSFASGPAAGMTWHGMRSTSTARCQPYQPILYLGQAT
jgi:hypothetical protein